MRSSCGVVFAFLLPFLSAYAQNSYPKSEVFLGYSYRGTRLGYEVSPDTSSWEGGNGWTFSFTGNFDRHFGFTADFAGQYGRRPDQVRHVFSGPLPRTGTLYSYRSYQFLFGPRFTLRTGRATPFLHTLFGLYRPGGDLVGTHFALAFGGGVDVALNDWLSVRVIQADWMPVKTEPRWDHHVRLQTGIVFTFGR